MRRTVVSESIWRTIACEKACWRGEEGNYAKLHRASSSRRRRRSVSWVGADIDGRSDVEDHRGTPRHAISPPMGRGQRQRARAAACIARGRGPTWWSSATRGGTSHTWSGGKARGPPPQTLKATLLTFGGKRLGKRRGAPCSLETAPVGQSGASWSPIVS